MSNVKFIGCLHLGHEWMAKYRGFENSNEHDNFLIKQWNKNVNKKDLIIILGDVTMEKSVHYHKLNQLNGTKIVVLGNHDLPKHTRELLNYVESVAGMIDYKGFALTHCPIHPSEIGLYKGNIHAHIHENELIEVLAPHKYKDKDSEERYTLNKYYNVDALKVNFIPQSIEQLLNNS